MRPIALLLPPPPEIHRISPLTIAEPRASSFNGASMFQILVCQSSHFDLIVSWWEKSWHRYLVVCVPDTFVTWEAEEVFRRSASEMLIRPNQCRVSPETASWWCIRIKTHRVFLTQASLFDTISVSIISFKCDIIEFSAQKIKRHEDCLDVHVNGQMGVMGKEDILCYICFLLCNREYEVMVMVSALGFVLD